jgi:hypothetical protein
MSEARRSRAVKMVVSTRRMMGLMSSSLVSFSMEMFSSEFSSPVRTSKVRPSLASSSTRCDCSVFLSRSVICESVATRAMMRCARRPAISSRTMRREGSLTAMTSASSLLLDGHEVVAEHQLDGDGAQQVVLDFEVFQVDEFGAIARARASAWDRSSCAGREAELRARLRMRLPWWITPFRACCAQREDGQVERDENDDDDDAHDDEDDAGSIKARAAVSAVATSSSKNSLTELSMAGSAPVCSPTVIISAARSGKTPVFSSDSARLLPSRTVLMEEMTALETRREEMERAAVSSDGTSDRPPVSSVESVRAKRATWYLSQILPKTGRPMRTASMMSLPRSVRRSGRRRTPMTSDGDADPDQVAVEPLAEVEQVGGDPGELGAELLIELANWGMT